MSTTIVGAGIPGTRYPKPSTLHSAVTIGLSKTVVYLDFRFTSASHSCLFRWFCESTLTRRKGESMQKTGLALAAVFVSLFSAGRRSR